MKKQRLLAFLVVTVMLLGTIFTGCGNNNNNSKTVNNTVNEAEETENNNAEEEETEEVEQAYNGPKVLNYYLGDEPETLDCQKMSGAPEFFVANIFIEGLTRFGKEEGQYDPGVAKKWTYDEATNTYTFELRDNAMWNNGEKVTGDDFLFAWKLALDNPDSYTFLLTDFIKGAAEYSALTKKSYLMEKDAAFKDLVGNAKSEKDEEKQKELNSQVAERIEGMSADEKAEFDNMKADLWANVGAKKDGNNLVVELAAPCTFFPGIVAFATFNPMNEKFYNEHKNDETNGYTLEAGGLLSNGPWYMKEWKHNESLKFARNEKYWNNSNINIDEINLKIVKDISTRTNLLKTGEIDGSAIQANDLKDFEDLGTLNQYGIQPLVNRPDYTVFYIEFNHFNNPITANLNIRKAFAYAMNRKDLVEKINIGDEAALSFVPTYFPGLNKSFREENGAQLFEDYQVEKAKESLAAGLEELGMEELPPLDMIVGTSDIAAKIAQLFQENWKEIGITVNLVPLPWGEKLQRLQKGQFGLCSSGWGPDYMDPMTFLDLYESTNGNNHGLYNNPEYDKLIRAAKTEANAEKRMQYMYDAEKLLIDDMVIAPQYNRQAHWAYKNYLTGVVNRGAGPSTDFYWADVDMDEKLSNK